MAQNTAKSSNRQLQQKIKELQNLFSWSQCYKWNKQEDRYAQVQQKEIPLKQIEIDELRKISHNEKV